MVGKISGIAWKEAVRELEGKKSCQVTIFGQKKIVINICNDKKITARFLPNSDRFRADSCAVERLKVNWNLCSSNSTSVSQNTLLDCT